MKEQLCELCHDRPGEFNSQSISEYGKWVCGPCEMALQEEEAGETFEGITSRCLEI